MVKRMLVIVGVITLCIVITIFAGSGEDTKGMNSRIQRPEAASSTSDVPEMMNYQGIVTDQDGNLLHGTYDLVFRIYDQETAPPGGAIWMEPHIGAQVDSGLVNILLGTVNPGLAESFDGSSRWLEVEVQGQLMTPRQPIASVPYAFRSGDGGGGDGHSLDAADGDPTNVVYVDDTGNVGIGTTTPSSKTALHIAENTPFRIIGQEPHAQVKISGTTNPDNQLRLGFSTQFKRGFIEATQWTGAEDSMYPLILNNDVYITGDASVGIGVSSPEAQLTVKSLNAQRNPFRVFDSDGNTCLHVWNNEGVSIGAGGTEPPEEGLYVKGILRIHGGSDIAEPFDIVESDAIEPGMVVAIDPENPGKLKVSNRAYNRCVAGIVSGAGGINPGLTLSQESAFEGDHQVALTGRVYGLCDASCGSIEPGDLLTSSPTAGHAMKVTDYEQAQGAIIGKAMTQLREGRGLVLILVSLQ